jgi:hypothetical protein
MCGVRAKMLYARVQPCYVRALGDICMHAWGDACRTRHMEVAVGSVPCSILQAFLGSLGVLIGWDCWCV